LLLAELHGCKAFDSGKQAPALPANGQAGCLSRAKSSPIPQALPRVSLGLGNPQAIIYFAAPEMLLEILPEALHQQKSCSPYSLPAGWGVLPFPSTEPHGGVGDFSSRQEEWEGTWF